MGGIDRDRRVSLLPGKTTRRRVLLALAAAGIAAPLTNFARPANRGIHRIGWLHLGKAWDLGQFRRPLAELGWIEDRNIAIEPRWADNDQDRLPALAAVAASHATATVPIVMAGSSNPVKLGIVHSLARPGGNITGLTVVGPQIAIKRMEILAAAVPGELDDRMCCCSRRLVGEKVEAVRQQALTRLRREPVLGALDDLVGGDDVQRRDGDRLDVLRGE